MADSHCYIAEINTTLKINYITFFFLKVKIPKTVVQYGEEREKGFGKRNNKTKIVVLSLSFPHSYFVFFPLQIIFIYKGHLN